MDDVVLSSHVRAIIAAHKNIPDHDIKVEANEGVVTIGGVVNSLVDADRIRLVVREVPGVKEVRSQMEVRLSGVTTAKVD